MVSLECVQCDFKCKTKSGLTVHKYVHGNAKYNCNICGSQFSKNGNLQTHIKSVHEKRKFSCLFCEKNHQPFHPIDACLPGLPNNNSQKVI